MKMLETTMLDMAACNGALHRYANQELVLQSMLKAIGDLATFEELQLLDYWLGALLEGDRLTLVDGEVTEMLKVAELSPLGEQRTQELLEAAFNAL